MSDSLLQSPMYRTPPQVATWIQTPPGAWPLRPVVQPSTCEAPFSENPADRMLLQRCASGSLSTRRIADVRQELQPAGVIAMRVAQEERVDFADTRHVRPQAGLGPVAEIEQESPAFRFQQKARRPFGPAA
jgi:hypothetical protein